MEILVLRDRGVEVRGGVGESLEERLVSISSPLLTCSSESLSSSGQDSSSSRNIREQLGNRLFRWFSAPGNLRVEFSEPWISVLENLLEPRFSELVNREEELSLEPGPELSLEPGPQLSLELGPELSLEPGPENLEPELLSLCAEL